MDKPTEPSWYQVTYKRRTGWVLTSQVEEIKVKKDSGIARKSLNFSGLSDRDKDKIELFHKYDV